MISGEDEGLVLICELGVEMKVGMGKVVRRISYI